MSAYTPGPWSYVDEREMSPEEPFWIGTEHPEFGFLSLAVVGPGSTEAEELGDTEDNARLIAAAPELLHCLAEVTGMLSACMDILSGNQRASQSATQELRKQHDKAIALLIRAAPAKNAGSTS